jgi:hypothetical protein
VPLKHMRVRLIKKKKKKKKKKRVCEPSKKKRFLEHPPPTQLITGMTRKTPSTARTLASVIADLLVCQVRVENALHR